MQKNLEPPLQLSDLDFAQLSLPQLERHFDSATAQLELRHRNRTERFSVFYRPDWTERSLVSVRNEFMHNDQGFGLAVLPYLSEDQLSRMALLGINCMDLCGNACIIFPDPWYIWISGRPNRFRIEQVLRNPYFGKASYVGRTLMRQPVFRKLEDIVPEISKRGGQASLSLVSRAVKQMREDVIVDSYPTGKVYLLQPDALLDRLAQAWLASKKTQVLWRGRVQGATTDFLEQIFLNAQRSGVQAVMTGLGSANHHSGLSMEDTAYLYASTAVPLLDNLNAQATDRFVNLEIRSSPDNVVYFDAVENDPRWIRWSSPVQTYLEMQGSDARMRDSSQVLRQRLISNALRSREVSL